jgi:putative transposase
VIKAAINHDYPASPNMLNRSFKVSAPNTSWVSNITFVATGEDWLYLAAVMDLYSGKIVGWAMDRFMTQQLFCDALKQADGRVKPPHGVIYHSDSGIQYAGKSYRTTLKKRGYIQIMSHKGNRWDNDFIGSFLGTLKTELIYHESYKTRTQQDFRSSIMLNLFTKGSDFKKGSLQFPGRL